MTVREAITLRDRLLGARPSSVKTNRWRDRLIPPPSCLARTTQRVVANLFASRRTCGAGASRRAAGIPNRF